MELQSQEPPSILNTALRGFTKTEMFQKAELGFFQLNPLPYGCPESVRLNFNSSVANGYWDVIRLSSQLVVYVVDNDYTSDFRLPYRASHDHVVFRFALSGAMQISVNNDGAIGLTAPCLHFVSTRSTSDVDLHYTKGSKHRMITIYANPKKLTEMLYSPHKSGSTEFSGDPIEFFSSRNQAIALSPEAQAAVADILSAQFFGPMRKTYVAAKVHELLCFALRDIIRGTSFHRGVSISEKDQRKVRHVFEMLSERYLDPPDINYLSRKVGLNRTVLRKYFRTIYGQTISEFCNNRRMAEARRVLLDSERPINQIAHHLGYRHSSNFTTAFKRHFGVLPKDFRRASEPEADVPGGQES